MFRFTFRHAAHSYAAKYQDKESSTQLTVHTETSHLDIESPTTVLGPVGTGGRVANMLA